jgi:hypothetical protein
VHLSSGQILFADPTSSWGPENLPNLPPTTLSIGVEGRIEDANVKSIRLTNAIKYEPYEHISLYPQLKKTLQISQDGLITYSEPKVGLVNTSCDTFSKGVNGFETSTIGGANILDVLSGAPDTLTNAIGKLDAWITNAFLQQPPTVQPVLSETNSLFSGIQWLNFDTYKILDKSVPYVTGIILIIGDPSGPDYCTLEITDPQYFPYKTFKDGKSPHNYPLVRLRVFTDFFVNSGTVVYTKRVLASNCIRIVTESGRCTIPAVGKVLSIENTDGLNSYTTLSIYLPGLQDTKDRPLPIRIAYMNHTEGEVNVAQSTITQTSTGGPSEPHTEIIVDNNAMNLRITRPNYSDSNANITSPFFSSYTIRYGFKQMNAVREGVGFMYGITDPLQTPAALTGYIDNISYDVKYTQPIQTIDLLGRSASRIIPGIVWDANLLAVNFAHIKGPEINLANISTMFPANNIQTISQAYLNATNTDISYAQNSSLMKLVYSDGWHTSVPVSNDVMFISTPTRLNLQLANTVQWNDSSYPGDRGAMKMRSFYTNIDNHRINTNVLIINSVNNDFILNTTINTIEPSSMLTTTVLETQNALTSQKYFYKANHSYSQVVSTISTMTQSIQLDFTNRIIPVSSPIREQVLSSHAYLYQVEPANPYEFSGAVYTSTCTSTIQISGLYTPSINSQFNVDIYGMNFANNYSYSNIAEGALYMGDDQVGPYKYLTSNIHIYNGTTPVTSLPLPQNTSLHISSVKFNMSQRMYQDPNEPREFNIRAYPISANPVYVQTAYQTSYSTCMFIDTVSAVTYSSFTNRYSPNGKRIVSLLPRLEAPGSSRNMNDSVDNATGVVAQGLNTTISSFVGIDAGNNVFISSFVDYNHTSSLSGIYTDMYSRELLYTNGKFMHPGGHNFSIFKASMLLGETTFAYPDFTYDMANDINGGYRYASFIYETPPLVAASLQFLYVKVINASYVSTIGTLRSNNFFPESTVHADFMTHMKVRMHAKIIGTYQVAATEKWETAWLNCLREGNAANMIGSTDDDKLYDTGAAKVILTPTTPIASSRNVEYKVQFSSKQYTKLAAIVRIGIALDGSSYNGDPLTFDSIQIRFGNT